MKACEQPFDVSTSKMNDFDQCRELVEFIKHVGKTLKHRYLMPFDVYLQEQANQMHVRAMVPNQGRKGGGWNLDYLDDVSHRVLLGTL